MMIIIVVIKSYVDVDFYTRFSFFFLFAFISVVHTRGRTHLMSNVHSTERRRRKK